MRRQAAGVAQLDEQGAAIASTTLPRLLPDPPTVGLDAHLRRFGPLPGDAAGLIEDVRLAGLRGRGEQASRRR